VIDIATERMGKYELEYDARFGWLKEGTLDYIRHVLVQYIEIQLQEMGELIVIVLLDGNAYLKFLTNI